MQHHLPRRWGHRDKRIPKGSENCQEGFQEGQDGHMHAGGGPRSQDNVAIGEWTSGIVAKTLSKIKFASREVAKIDLVEGAKRLDWLQVDGQRRALREKEETRHHRGSEDQVPEQGETRQAVGGGEAVEGDRD